MDTRKGLSKELSREWNMHMKLNTGVSHLKNRRKLNNRGMGTVEMILIIVEKPLMENIYVLCGN